MTHRQRHGVHADVTDRIVAEIKSGPKRLWRTRPDEIVPKGRVHERLDPAFMAAVAKTGARIRHGCHVAAYSPDADEIYLPPVEKFINQRVYQGALAHELVHWTGHTSRLARESIKASEFHETAYAFEEVVAELGAAMLLEEFGIGCMADRHANYIANYLTRLPRPARKEAFHVAATHATAAINYLHPAEEELAKAA